MSIRFVVVVGICFVYFDFGSLVASGELHVSGLPVNQMGFGLQGADALSAHNIFLDFARFM